MGGKDKQRTKGNVKPSSSGRAAALMSKDGTVGFVGFGGLMGSPGSSNLGYVPMAAGAVEDVDATVDSEFRMVMRKLMKRDSVTKLKAVQEFTDLCKNSTAEAVESALPFWPRLFNKLAMDIDHRVREATQQAMEQLVLKVGRNLAPHLRYVIGPWLCAQFDTYAVVASSGKRSFQAAFSDEKQVEVIMFCRKELFEYLQDNILTQTPSTLSDPKFVSEEEREAKYNRVVSSSISALGKLMSVTSDKNRAEMEELYLNILQQNKFWKYSKHKSPNVRGAVFSTISLACETFPSMMLSLSSQVSPAVLSALDDSDPAVCQYLWDAVLSVLNSITDCWKQVNVRKAVLPKLWSVLKNGGNGCATIIFPNLLPFLSKVPSEVVGDGVGFFHEFFSNLREGLLKERVQNSSSECSSVIAAFMECLRFCLLHEFGGKGADSTVQEYLIKEQLLSVMENSLEKQSKLAQTELYSLVASLLSYLSVKSESESKSDGAGEMGDGEEKLRQQFRNMSNLFWEGMSNLCLQQLKPVDQEVHHDAVASVSHCLVSLKKPATKRRKQHKVAFTESSSEVLDNKTCEHGSALRNTNCHPMDLHLTGSEDVEKLYCGCLLDLVCDICTLCLDEISQTNSLNHLNLLSRLVPHFTSTRLMRTLTRTGEHSSRLISVDEDNYCVLSECFLNGTLFSWINVSCEPSLSDTNGDDASGGFKDNKSVDYVITIFCGIMKTLPLEKQEELASKYLQQNSTVSFLYKVLEQGLQSDVLGIIRWLYSAEGNERLLALTRGLVLHVSSDFLNIAVLSDGDRRIVWKLLQLCIVSKRNVVMLEKDFVENIFQLFIRILRQSEQDSERELLPLLDILKMYLTNCGNSPGDVVPCIEDLLLAVFQLQLVRTLRESSSVSQSVAETWQKGLQVLSQVSYDVDSSPCETLLLRAASFVYENLTKGDTLESVENVVKVAVCLLQDSSRLSKKDEHAHKSLSQSVFEAITPKEQDLKFFRNEYSKSQWLLEPLLNGKLPVMSDVPDQLNECQTTQSTLTNHQNMILFFSSLVNEILSNADDSSFLERVSLPRSDLVRLWLEMSWVRQWCSCVLGYSDMAEQYIASDGSLDQAIYSLLVKLQTGSRTLLDHIDERDWCGTLITDGLAHSRTDGFLWCLVLEDMLQELKRLDLQYDSTLLLTEVQSLASLEEKECQTLDTLLNHLDGIYELKVITEQFAALLSQENDERGFARLLAIISGSLRKWFIQSKGTEEALLECQLTLTGLLDDLVEWNSTHDSLVLINSPLDETVSMGILSLNLSLARILEMAVRHCPDMMNNKHWDFVLCVLAGWLQTCEENRSMLTTSLKCVALCCQVCSLFCNVARFFQENASKLSKVSNEAHSSDVSNQRANVSSENTPEFPPNLLVEWQEFFSGNLFTTVLQLFLYHAGECQDAHFEVSLWSNRISESLGSAVIFTPTSLLKEHKFHEEPHAITEDASKIPRWLEDLMAHCLPLMNCNVHGLQVAAYHILSRVMPDIATLEENVSESEESEDEPIRSPPTPLIELINSTSAHIAEMLREAQVPFGEHLDMAGDREAQNVSLALLLAWKVLLHFFRSLPQEKRVEYAKYIRQNKMVDSLLGVLFRLMPLKATGATLADDCEPVIGRCGGQRTIQELACSVCYSLLQWMPAIVRQWWNGLDKRQSAIVDKFTTSVITPQLCQREMQLVQNSSVRFDNMLVKARPSAREVAAVYTVEDMSMELVVKLAPNHPLGVVSVESGRKIGVATAQWRSWMLQMTTFLTHQNGSIMDGLILWKRNVDKRFEGVDDCMICFSVIHGSNYSLPKLSCKTCKKKFHSACLYKWFSTSNNATCPLCRNLF